MVSDSTGMGLLNRFNNSKKTAKKTEFQLCIDDVPLRVHTTFNRRNVDEYGPLMELKICRIDARLAQLKFYFPRNISGWSWPSTQWRDKTSSLRANLTRLRPSGTVPEDTISMWDLSPTCRECMGTFRCSGFPLSVEQPHKTKANSRISASNQWTPEFNIRGGTSSYRLITF